MPTIKKATIENKNNYVGFLAMSLKLNIFDFKEGDIFMMQKRNSCIVCKKYISTYSLCCYQNVCMRNQKIIQIEKSKC